MENDRLNTGLKEFNDSDTVEQSLALADIVRDLLNTTKQHLNKIYVLLAISLIANIVIVGAFLWHESRFTYEEKETVETTTTTQTVSGKDSEINNVRGNMYKDNATHNDNTAKQDKE